MEVQKFEFSEEVKIELVHWLNEIYIEKYQK